MPPAETGRSPEAIIRNPDLARTYRLVAKEGPDVFYKGSIAKEMVEYVRKNGGLWTMADLANYRTIWDRTARDEIPRPHGLRRAAAFERRHLDGDAEDR